MYAEMEEILVMLTELKNARKTIGLKQSKKAIGDGDALRAYIAMNADERIRYPVSQLCEEHGVEIFQVPSMMELGNACGINVGAAVAVLLK